MKKLLFSSAILATIIVYSCNSSEKATTSSDGFVDPISAHIDSSISPGENFFMFANNGWFKKHPIPSSEKSNGIFQTINDTINEAIKKICESSASKTTTTKGSNEQKIGDFYFSGMDTARIKKAGASLLNDEFSKIDAIKNTSDLITQVVLLQKMNITNMFGFAITRA